MEETETCGGCQAAPGTAHGPDCDHALCPDCGTQLSLHAYERCDAQVKGPDRPSLWHGLDQRASVARSLGWWTTVVGLDHLVEDYSRVVVAIALGQLRWDPQSQTYIVGRIDAAALDRVLARNGC